MLDGAQKQCRRETGDAGQESDNDDRAAEFEGAPTHAVKHMQRGSTVYAAAALQRIDSNSEIAARESPKSAVVAPDAGSRVARNMPRQEVPRLLFVHAHPDDETLATGATIAHYAALGAQVCVVTCTLGEEGR